MIKTVKVKDLKVGDVLLGSKRKVVNIRHAGEKKYIVVCEGQHGSSSGEWGAETTLAVERAE